jgi:cyclic nucleotide gated channel
MLLLSCLSTVDLKYFMQIVIWFIIPATRNQETDHNNNALALIVLLQYVPRLYLIFPLSSQIVKATGVVTKTAWAGAAYNLLLYMLASHVCTSVSFSFF